MAVTLRQIAQKARFPANRQPNPARRRRGISCRDTRYCDAGRARTRLFANAAARATRDGFIPCVALILSEISYLSLLDREMLDGFEGALARHKHYLLVSRLPENLVADGSNLPASCGR